MCLTDLFSFNKKLIESVDRNGDWYIIMRTAIWESNGFLIYVIYNYNCRKLPIIL